MRKTSKRGATYVPTITPFCTCMPNVAFSQSLWAIIFEPASEGEDGVTVFYCTSKEPTSEVNPGNASWYCKYTSSGKQNHFTTVILCDAFCLLKLINKQNTVKCPREQLRQQTRTVHDTSADNALIRSKNRVPGFGESMPVVYTRERERGIRPFPS